MIRFEDVLEKVRAYSPDADVELLRRAYVFSAFEHRGQVRHSGEPYLIHPLAVADFLADMKLDVVAIAAGLLHDVVEDTLTTIERIQELFGPEVAHVVQGVSKVKTELEELSFRYLEPQTYEALRARVDAKRRATEGFIEELKNTIAAKLQEAQVPVLAIDGRIKRLWSIDQKLKRQKIELEQV